MNWTGKIVGALLGFLLAGPFGFVLGLIIGHYFDYGNNPLIDMNAKRHREVQQAFFRYTFLIMGHIAKADGRISEEQIKMARNIMKSMLLTKPLKREAIQMFNKGKAPDFRLDDAIDTLQQYCGTQRNLLRIFLDFQIRAATAEGYIGPNKKRILEHLATRLQFNLNDFPLFIQSSRPYEYKPGGKREYKRGYESRTESAPSEIEEAYRTLGITKEASDTIVKRAYRRKMSENHPDRLVAKGLPEEMVKLATEKTQEIKAAYDIIRKRRGMK